MTSVVTGQVSGTPAVSVAAQQLAGSSGSLSVKAPCRVATTANITLNAPQTIDGVSIVAGDRVLVWHQTSAVDNGIWIAQAGAWTRAVDFNGAGDATGGTLVYVGSEGTSGAHLYRVTTTGSFTIGTSSINFAIAFPNITISTSAPSGGLDGDVWFKIS